jgi:outer membrane protein assembly factor BamD (BamD/ComL family)
VDDYDRFYRRGPLAPESTSVRVEALLLQGNADAAIHLADRFLAANPKSPYAAHIRLLVERARTP